MKGSSASFVRRQEEKTRFKHLLGVLVWAKDKTGRSSEEIVSIILRNGKDGFERLFYQ